MPPEKLQWSDLYKEVVTSGLCTGCSACVIVCPYNVLGYDDEKGVYRPFHVPEMGGTDNCLHGEKGCTLCTRACPRFRSWEPDIDRTLFGREREESEVYGIAQEVILARATDPELLAAGQDGAVVSAILIWALEHDLIDAALVSNLSGENGQWKAVPGVARNRAEVLVAAGARYTYSPNLGAYAAAAEGGAERIALVGTGCQASATGAMVAHKAGKVARHFALTVGLLCSKTFDDAIFSELFDARYGLEREEIVKMNIKGIFQVWTRDGMLHDVPLKEAQEWTRQGCKQCPDFSAEHADISTGGIGMFPHWTLTIVRTDKGRELISAMSEAGALEVRSAVDEDPDALELLCKLARLSRRRWPKDADKAPGRIQVASA
jgi:coenzyme F420 hydrogenase subunit beta